ncbi:hypothetical protein I551_1006 [Mycobacterium ulcerans str. Harvey]|uniref:Uncharacterized protein n=1 Tax=Mycobacterium ulcerans str. Harvey TaxID=1299332 RepID=A0ABN0R609_MYCUL|nr:hypothetical protein I551_1006 [Mycobacterium ulcerans str. Harvey]
MLYGRFENVRNYRAIGHDKIRDVPSRPSAVDLQVKPDAQLAAG